MGYYFADHLSMAAALGADLRIEATLETIARRYVGSNPAHPLTYRRFTRTSILRGKDYRYHMDLARIFPKARPEQYVYAWAAYWSDGPAELKADVNCFGPMVVYLNGPAVFTSDIFTERYPDQRHRVPLPMAAGWNHVVLRFKKTRAGFGGIFGTWLGKHPYYFLLPRRSNEMEEEAVHRTAREGWLLTEPLDQELAELPGATGFRAAETVQWLPEVTWSAQEGKKGQLARLFGTHAKACAAGWTRAFFDQPGRGQYLIRGSHSGAVRIFIDGNPVFTHKASGRFSQAIEVGFGGHDVLVLCDSPGGSRASSWGFGLEIEYRSGGHRVDLTNPCGLANPEFSWIFIGPLTKSDSVDVHTLCDLRRVHRGVEGDTYWRLDKPDTWIRPYNENPLFGRWNYPLGVTLYGLLHAARAVGSHEIQQYIRNHIQLCCDTFGYAQWDKEQYGGATTIHNLLSSIDSLDDCGSFGAAMLEAAKLLPIEGYREIADYVADYIANKQARLPDGTFYRKMLMHVFHENTLWADDLYMSVPFLCRYAELTGDQRYLDDAAKQFLGFKERLFIPELKVMSHVYDLRREMATGVPWGRGNGWTIFSLSELLAVLPAGHRLRSELLAFYRELCEGILRLQDESGMWHQVLTHPDSYPETSCTAMFIYAFARGVRFGWVPRPERYVGSVMKGWDALCRTSIDRGGNVHGVCRGSEFSFSPEYYKKDLLWNLNDTHGIGIVLLAGVEVIRLRKHLEQTGATNTDGKSALTRSRSRSEGRRKARGKAGR
jgi:unsaturated rhamnogalacturonyl hydrolase